MLPARTNGTGHVLDIAVSQRDRYERIAREFLKLSAVGVLPSFLPQSLLRIDWEVGLCAGEQKMNAKQVESLAETISALSSEDYSLLQSILISKTVQKTPGVCGGHARVRNTRIPVWTLVSLAQQGMGEDELLEDFPGLTHFDLLAAQSYYQANKIEIDNLITSHHSDEDWYV